MKQLNIARFGAALLAIAFVGCSPETSSTEESSAASTSPPMMEATPNTTGDPEAIRPFERSMSPMPYLMISGTD